MKNNKYFFNTLLAAVLFAVMAVFMVIRVIQPAAVLPPLNIPMELLAEAMDVIADALK